MEILVGISTVYIFTWVLVYSSGPFYKLEFIRENKKVKAFGLLECFTCTAFWMSIIVLCAYGLEVAIVSWAVASIIDNMITIYSTKD